jgi:hypothetical protein
VGAIRAQISNDTCRIVETHEDLVETVNAAFADMVDQIVAHAVKAFAVRLDAAFNHRVDGALIFRERGLCGGVLKFPFGRHYFVLRLLASSPGTDPVRSLIRAQSASDTPNRAASASIASKSD